MTKETQALTWAICFGIHFSCSFQDLVSNFILLKELTIFNNRLKRKKITTDKINISGTIRGSDLIITDVESESESITTESRLILSKDKNYLTLIPSDIKFKRKTKS